MSTPTLELQFPSVFFTYGSMDKPTNSTLSIPADLAVPDASLVNSTRSVRLKDYVSPVTLQDFIKRHEKYVVTGGTSLEDALTDGEFTIVSVESHKCTLQYINQ